MAIAAAAGAVALMIVVGASSPKDAPIAIQLQAAGPVVATLPLKLPTGDAQQVITIDAPNATSTTATLRAWDRVPGGWVPMTPDELAHTAVGGLTQQPSEEVPATPVGSFTLTQAFGKLSDPGTTMPYFQVTPGDWWISQPGPLYNTHQLCTLACPFLMRSPNTHLMDTVRAYNYALVLDYNRFPVVQGAGSAYFLHVTTAGRPTKGCIGVAQPVMAGLLRWLLPSASPRILIGVG
ncbi:MAG TPA: L,D-transpeptidase family protein [Jatrophihabitantaceae bacterium]